ncbi:helix-hairpin-helix domain-containing protein [Neobacillus mesonae]|uniref:helix-hairpin-helix domain-containing protein n=1 Tax=Neobacillus mesonae TaxID=1193713 RepID=UPI00203D7B10|nr:helix-hairpin-helix domain-containing protein [Neobacillus mesonae]MCM3566547.1 helix-hairpin-helix domain-containing protein [Neobacillus mesonae]
MKNWIMEHKLYVILAVLVVIGGLYYFNETRPIIEPQIQSKALVDENLEAPAEEHATKEKQEIESKPPEKMMVDVKGQIKLPGVYQASEGERVIDVITRAGGLTDKADKSQVNLAEHIQDEMVIYVPEKGEEGIIAAKAQAGGGDSRNPGSAANQQRKINLNKANSQELQNLPGVGPAKADAIIEFRETKGGFKTVDDLKNISGIGDKTFEKLKDLVDIH